MNIFTSCRGIVLLLTVAASSDRNADFRCIVHCTDVVEWSVVRGSVLLHVALPSHQRIYRWCVAFQKHYVDNECQKANECHRLVWHLTTYL